MALVDRLELGREVLDCRLDQRQGSVVHHATGAAILPFRQAGDYVGPDRLQFAQPPHGRRRQGLACRDG